MPEKEMMADAPLIHRYLVKLLQQGIGLATFLRTPESLIHPVLCFEAIEQLEAAGYSVDPDLVVFVLQTIRDSKHLK
jgi:hypothetical protein